MECYFLAYFGQFKEGLTRRIHYSDVCVSGCIRYLGVKRHRTPHGYRDLLRVTQVLGIVGIMYIYTIY